MAVIFASLSCLLTLPVNAGELKIVNDRFTHGPQGAPRADAKFLPGDVICMMCEVENFSLDKEGKADYSITVEAVDEKGKLVFKKGPRNAQTLNCLGGNRMPLSGIATVGTDQPAGKYTLNITITDRIAKKDVTFKKPMEVLPAAFGIVQVGINLDPEGNAFTPPIGTIGQSFYFNFGAIGFVRDSKKQPHIAIELVILDSAGKPTFPTPLAGAVKGDVPADVKVLPLQQGVVLNKEGSFTAKIKIIDKNNKDKTAEVSIPFKVIAAP